MRKQVRRRHDAHTRASSVCAEHADIFDAAPGGKKVRTTLANNVASVTRLLRAQEATVNDRREATERSRQARERLREAAKAVVSIGKFVHLDLALMDTMQLPGPITDDEMIAYAGALYDRVAPHADAFVAEGLPPDLLKNLADAIQSLETAREQQALARQRFAGTSESIRDVQDKSDSTITALEAIALNTPAAKPEVLKKLRMAKRVGPRLKPDDKAPVAAPPSAVPPGTPSSTPSNDKAA